jgi:ADP-heptose:LPS heptosyltransferase
MPGSRALQLTLPSGILLGNRGDRRRVSLPYKKILIVRTDRLGDVLLTLPVFPLLRESFPGAHLSMLVRRYPGGLVEGNPHVDSVIWYDREGTPVPLRQLLPEIRSFHFDAAVVARPTWRIAWLLLRAGIPVRIGTGYRAYSLLFTRRVYEHRRDAGSHELEYNLRLLSPLGVRPPDVPFTPDFGIHIPPEIEKGIVDHLRSAPDGSSALRVVLHPGSGGSAREWPAPRFAELGRRLRETFACQIVVTGTEQESKKMRTVIAALDGRAVTFSGTLSLPELAAVLRNSSLVVSNSTGPLHLAVAVGTPVLGLYPPVRTMSARRWGPYSARARVLEGAGSDDCRKCAGGGPCTCMESITVDLAFREAKGLMEGVDEKMPEAGHGR